MRRVLLRMIAIAFGAVIAGPVFAAFDCTGTFATQGAIALAPSSPTSAQVVSVRLNVGKFQLTGVQTNVAGNEIDIATFGYLPSVYAPVEFCEIFDIGPLPAGTYTVNLQRGGLMPGPIDRAAPKTAIGTLVVLAAAALSPIPTLQPALLIALTIVLGATAGGILLRRR